MGEPTVRRFGMLRESCWTRVRLAWRTAHGTSYEVERFEPVPRGAEAFLRDQLTYFGRLGFRVMSLQVSQAERFDGRRLGEPNPSRHWQPQGFLLAAQYPEGTDDVEALIALVRGSAGTSSEDAIRRETSRFRRKLVKESAEVPASVGLE